MPQIGAITAYEAIAYLAAAIASKIISGALTELTDKRPGKMDSRLGFQANTRSTERPLPLIYGTTRVGVNFAYIGSSGSDNEYLHLIGLIGEGELDSIKNVDGVDQVFLDNKIYTDFGDNVYYEFFNGSSTQNVCATLNSSIPEWTDPLRHTAYIYLRLKFDPDYFQNVPTITVTVNGLKCYDPELDAKVFTDNPAICAYEYLTRPSIRGGFGVSSDRVKESTVIDSKTYCASKGWTCNMPLAERQPVADNMELLLSNFRGDMIYSSTLFSIKFRDINEEIVSMSFDEDSVIEDSFRVSLPDVFDMPNAIRIAYLDEEGSDDGTSTYKEKSFPLSYEETITEDGDYREQTIKCLGLSNLDSVQKMAYYFYERLRANKPFSFTAGQSAAELEPSDLIQLSHKIPGWVSKMGRVENVIINQNDTVSISCIEEFSALYDDVFDPSSITWFDTILPNSTDRPSSVINFSLYEEQYYYRERSYTRLRCNFSAPPKSVDPFFSHAEIYVKIGSGEYENITTSTGDYLLDPVEEGIQYSIKLLSVSISGSRQFDADAIVLSRVVVGKTDSPSSLSSMTAVANGDSVSIYANPITDPDNEGYEVRLGVVWDGAVFISFNKNCSLRLNGVRPGTHPFWMSPKNNANKYSDSPVSATVKVFIPPGYTQLPTYGAWSWDFTTGTFTNTEHAIIDASDALKCSHTGDVLTGIWESSTYDLNSVENVRLWGDFITQFSSSDTTWIGVAPSPTTWNDLGSSLTWNEIFNPTAAGVVEAKLKYSTDNVSWSEISFFQILCAEVTARYIKVEITLTDPTLDANIFLKELNMVAYEGPQQ